MGFFEAIASAFINTFGITQPTPENRRRAAWMILGMLLLVAVAVSMGGWMLYHVMHP